jgi:hypothetical protein
LLCLIAHRHRVAGTLGRFVLMVGFAAVSVPSPAGAATIQVRTLGGPAGYDEVLFTASPGEANRVTVQRGDGPGPTVSDWTIREEGAPLVHGPGCRSQDSQTVRCEASKVLLELGDAADRLEVAGVVKGLETVVAVGGPGDDVLDAMRFVVEPFEFPGRPPPPRHTLSGEAEAGATLRGGDGMDHLLGGTRMSGGNGDDLLQGSLEGDQLDGGQGADRLEGAAGEDVLQGGGGRDTLLAGPGTDRLSDGDRTGATGERAPDGDLLDGGPGRHDRVEYRRRAPVTIDLTGRRSSGEAGEGDTVLGMEDAWGGHRGDWLRGNDEDNELSGFSGDDVLIGGRGRDIFGPGEGNAKVTCGPGRDLLLKANHGTVVRPDCEGIWPPGDPISDDGFPSLYPVRRRPGAVTYRIACPSRIDNQGNPFGHARCRATLRLTTASKPHRTIAQGRLPFGSWGRGHTMVVSLTPAGRRLVKRRSGVLALATLRLEKANGSVMAHARWAIRLK